MNSLRTPLVTALLALALLAPAGGCKNRDKGGSLAELTPPKDAPVWESRYAVAFDDSYTPTSINLQGRAPNDVLDQQLFQARLGHAAVVALVRVEQVWGKGRYQGRQKQFLEVQIGEVLMGSLPKDAPERIMLEVDGNDELPGTLKAEVMLLFLRWDTESEPPYHHHLMPADEELVALINAMVKHAQAEGVLDAKGDEKKGGRGRKSRRKGKRDRKDKGKGKGKGGPVEPVDDSSAPVGTPIGGEAGPVGGSSAPDEPPPSGPEPDASTGLDKLGGDPAPEESAPEESAPEPNPKTSDQNIP